MAFALIGILGCAALAVDVGSWRYQQRLAQTAADGAAVAGADEIVYDSTQISTAANRSATLNGFSGFVSQVNNPPLTGHYAGDPNSVEVVISKPQSNFFAGIFGISTSVGARAVAQLNSTTTSCMYVLAPPGLNPDGIQMTNGGVSTSDCGIVDNGTYSVGGPATITAPSITYYGTLVGSINNSNYPQPTAPATWHAATPAPAPGPTQADPCSALPACATLTNDPPNTTTCGAFPNGSPSQLTASGTIHPGVYCGGIKINGATVTMTPGLYVLTGQGFNMSSGNVTATGVSIYLAGNSSSITINNGTLNMSAPTTSVSYTPASGGSGTLPPGLLFYQLPTNSNQDNLTDGNASCSTSGNFSGILYAPGAVLKVTNGAFSPSTLIVGGFSMTNGVTSCITPYGPGSVIERAAIVE